MSCSLNGINGRPAGALMVQKLKRIVHVPKMMIMTVVWNVPPSHGALVILPDALMPK